jgi:hypothetical protein
MFYELAIIFRRAKPALNRVLKYDRMTRLPSTAPADLGDPKRGRPHTRYKPIRAFITMCRDERISFADPLLPPSYPRSPVPTSSGPFCLFIRAGERVLRAHGNTKPAAFAAGFLFVGMTGFEPATPTSRT